MVRSSFGAGAEMMTFLTVSLQVRLRLGGIGEMAGRFDHDLRAGRGPVELGGIALGEHLELLAVDGDEIIARGDGVGAGCREWSRT